MSGRISLTQLGLTFLKIGALGFGGPFSLLAIMQKEVVERNKWLTADEFTQSVGIGTVTPGPIFFAAAIFVGYRLRGIPGAAICGLGTLLPSFILAVILAALYVEVESSPLVMGTVRGIAAGVVGLVLSVVLKTGRSTMKDVRSIVWVVLAFIAMALLKVDPLLLIVIAGITGAWLLRPSPKIQTAEK
jgi:chromate transporter